MSVQSVLCSVCVFVCVYLFVCIFTININIINNFKNERARFLKVTHDGVSLREKLHSGVVYQTGREGLS